MTHATKYLFYLSSFTLNSGSNVNNLKSLAKNIKALMICSLMLSALLRKDWILRKLVAASRL